MSNIPSIIGGVIALATINRLLNFQDDKTMPGQAPKPLIPAPVITKPVVATRAKPITPFITVQQRAEQAAFQRKQEAMTRAELLRIGPSGYRSL